jgi:riboflavin kinase/FMN adenylyltransferase
MHNLKPEHHGNVVTIGSFDGVHLGHQSILKQTRQKALELGLPSLVMIFEPQPYEYFAEERAPARLMRLREKVLALFGEGVDRVCCLPFNKYLSQLSADEFVQKILVDGIGTKSLVVGDDFRYGSGRTGNYDDLKKAGKLSGFSVTDTQTFLIDGERVSSTRIRQLLRENDFEAAKKLLGKPYTIRGKVVMGNQLGRKIGAPTANVHLHRYRSPLSGVFAVIVTLPSNEGFEIATGVANVGVRPTLGDIEKPILEVHLFDRGDDLYGKEIVVEFKSKLREEQYFESLDQLQQQIKEDFRTGRQFFNQSTELI